MLSLTLRQIEYAVAVGSHGGMSAAASALHVSQPALSVALAQLEGHLGQPLFLRRPGGRLVPTSFGQRWLAKAEEAVQVIATLADPTRLSGQTLRLAVFKDLAASCLGPLLAAVAKDAPLLNVVPSLLEFEELTTALRMGRADLALTWDLGLEADIARQTLARIPPHAVLAAEHPLAAHSALSLNDLADQPLILTDQGLSISHMRALFAKAGLMPRIAHRAASLDLMRSLAANGLGVGLSYTNPAARLSQDGRALVTRPLTDAGAEAIVLAKLTISPETPGTEMLARLLPGLIGPPAFPDRLS
ncbi:LysR family transcriptional regulator [Tabrizicola sp.]|uniref:LysR family transcriptional regulator n=1 Tax=Tabrizicola sp. TaxID=2005166 RepID=UPI003D2D9FCD